MAKPQCPVPGQIYTLAIIEMALELRDSPSLCVLIDGREWPIQNSHLTVEQLLSVPGLGATRWRYSRTTHEWIPCFHAVEPDKVLACIDVARGYDTLFKRRDYWLTPKGFERPPNDGWHWTPAHQPAERRA
jgi:hypothetical protein